MLETAKLGLGVDGKDLGAVTKDALEDRLHRLVISGRLDLKQAQKEISADWTATYRKYVGESPAYQIGDRTLSTRRLRKGK